ncbi:MAG: DUF1376 domain-containing protein, partial [Alphaproteobacteria bacterium]
HLTAAQDGVYSRLLRWYYLNERTLPDNDQALAGIARVGIDEWLPMAAVIRAFFVTRLSRVTGQSTLQHKRCNIVIQSQNKKRRDGKSRQEKLRKNGVLEDVTRYVGVSNAARGEERRDSESVTTTQNPTTTASVESPAPPVGAAPPTGKPPKVRKPKTVRTRLPPDWEPTEGNRAYAKLTGLADAKIDTIAIGFRRYWTGPDAKQPLKADWDRTWENWVDREIQAGALNRGNGRGRSSGNDGGRVGWAARVAQTLDHARDPDVLPERRDEGGFPPVHPQPSAGVARKRPGFIPGPDPGETVIEPDSDG